MACLFGIANGCPDTTYCGCPGGCTCRPDCDTWVEPADEFEPEETDTETSENLTL